MFPVLYLALVSVKPQPEVLSGRFLPSRLAWENWPNAFRSVPLLLFLRNSVVVAVASALLTLLLAVPASYAMVRFQTGGKGLASFVLSSYVAPPVVALLPLFFLLRWAGLIDSLPGVALVHALANLPVAVWLLDSFVRSLPREIEEASWVDGAGLLATLRRSSSPSSRPASSPPASSA
jgi:multiple sugar transport system permease protein